MARITVEDCARVVPNRFELVVLAANRAHAILAGSKPLVERDNTEPILALREIAEGKISIETLRATTINKLNNGRKDLAVSFTDKPKFFNDEDFGDSIFADVEEIELEDKFSEPTTNLAANFASQNLDIND